MSQTTTTNSQWPHNNNPHDDTASRDNDKERAHPRRPQAPWRLRDLHLVGMAKLPIQSASTRALFGIPSYRAMSLYSLSNYSTPPRAARVRRAASLRASQRRTGEKRTSHFPPRIRGESPTMHPATRVEVGVKLSKFIQHSKQKRQGLRETVSPWVGLVR